MAEPESLLAGELHRIHYLTAIPRGRSALDRDVPEARRVVLVTAWVELYESPEGDRIRVGADHIAEERLAVDVWADAAGRLFSLSPRAGGIFRGAVLLPHDHPADPPPLRLVAYQHSTGRMLLRGFRGPDLEVRDSRATLLHSLPRVLLRTPSPRTKGRAA